MTAQKGSLMLLKIGNGGTPETFATIGGMRVTELIHENQLMQASDLESGAWRKLLTGAGLRAITISGDGIFTDSAAEETLRSTAMSHATRNYQLTFGNGDSMIGAFQVASYKRRGMHDDAESYSITLASAGEIVVV
jgi:TP901-1 family phage major tail protein